MRGHDMHTSTHSLTPQDQLEKRVWHACRSSPPPSPPSIPLPNSTHSSYNTVACRKSPLAQLHLTYRIYLKPEGEPGGWTERWKQRESLNSGAQNTVWFRATNNNYIHCQSICQSFPQLIQWLIQWSVKHQKMINVGFQFLQPFCLCLHVFIHYWESGTWKCFVFFLPENVLKNDRTWFKIAAYSFSISQWINFYFKL